MFDIVRVSLNAISVALTLGFSLYCLRLLTKFFREGIFETSFKAFSASGLLAAGGLTFHIIAQIMEFKLFPPYIVLIGLNFLSGAILFYGVRKLYKAWTRLESR